ncbi:unnamed protein product [Mytilus edulis]|uniref:Tesmin/TSO1-like CXC domain-containing protein n=1 Tax=Mytilus edulis TaxID=6550 RepID=A0A8S3SZ89_MYTED|nr:unnamed protein product [Mytilus edulis]
MLITDTADKFSNSSTDFLAILSRFGICVSKDTHKRFLSDVVEQNNTTESTPFKSFAIGSYDNIDKNQVHSSVTAGKSNSGFHGTSVQIVEPLPETLLHSVTNSSSENSILETTDPLTTLLNSSSTSEMSTSTICTADELPIKGEKSGVVKNSLSFTNSNTTGIILEGMFIINSRPLGYHVSFLQYASFLFDRWVLNFYARYNASEIHVLFDDPERNGPSPKDVERARRDLGHQYHLEISDSISISDSTPLPSDWQKFLFNRQNKRKLVQYLSVKFLELSKSHDFVFVTTGCFEGNNKDNAICVLEGEIFEYSKANGNHEESDSRVWLHASASPCLNILIYSPDTDVCFVGLPLIMSADSLKNKTIFIQLKDSKFEKKFLDMNALSNFLDKIREKIWDRIINEDEMMPTAEALKFHWMRGCWVSDMWDKALHSSVTLLNPMHYGWEMKPDYGLSIIWDTPENYSRVEHTVLFLTKGCNCKTGCVNNRCLCRRKGNVCGPGCSCTLCKNTSASTSSQSLPVQVSVDTQCLPQSPDITNSTGYLNYTNSGDHHTWNENEDLSCKNFDNSIELQNAFEDTEMFTDYNENEIITSLFLSEFESVGEILYDNDLTLQEIDFLDFV